MGKRKTDDFIASDEEDDEYISDESKESVESTEVKPKSRKSKGKVTVTKQNDSDEEQSKNSKKSKAQTPKSVKKPKIGSPSKDVVVQINSDNEQYIDLGKKKRATVRAFKGIPLIDIREFYGAEGDEKPGKKGISLTGEQWESLKKGSAAIDKLFAQLQK